MWMTFTFYTCMKLTNLTKQSLIAYLCWITSSKVNYGKLGDFVAASMHEKWSPWNFNVSLELKAMVNKHFTKLKYIILFYHEFLQMYMYYWFYTVCMMYSSFITFFISFSPNHAGICTFSILMDRSSSINCLYLSHIYWSAVDCACSYCSCFIASACTNSSCEIIYKTKVRVMICIIHDTCNH